MWGQLLDWDKPAIISFTFLSLNLMEKYKYFRLLTRICGLILAWIAFPSHDRERV